TGAGRISARQRGGARGEKAIIRPRAAFGESLCAARMGFAMFRSQRNWPQRRKPIAGWQTRSLRVAILKKGWIARLRVQQKSDVSATGLVTLVIGGGLTFWGAARASQQGFTFHKWADENPTKIAALVSATQLATTGAKLAMTGHYSRSAFGTTADAFAVAQLAAFAFGSLSTGTGMSSGKRPIVVHGTQEAIGPKLPDLKPNDVVLTDNDHQTWEIILDNNNNKTWRALAHE